MSWSAQGERGSGWLTRAALWLALRGAGPVLTVVGTGWFLLMCRGARLASRDYLRRVLGRPAGFADVARHFHCFACAVVDRVLLLAGRQAGFRIRTEGIGAVLDVLAEGRGCILLGAHLGSFEVLRTVAAQAPVPVWALMYRRNGGALTGLLDRLAPGLHERVLEIGDTASMIRARECVERGEIVGILADRAPNGHRMVRVPFLGEAAAFPSGPFVLANVLGAPVVLFHAVRTGGRTYDVVFEAFAERVVLRRGARAEDLRAVMGRYAAAVERGCRAHPYQWFNFYPFWEGGLDAGVEAVASVRAAAVVAGGG
jgi:predicted LPLAT superfamily acyltransferase